MSEALSDWTSIGENEFCGWLEKMDEAGGFSKRWFVLHGGCLTQYRQCPPGALRHEPKTGTGIAADICEIVDLREGFSFPGGAAYSDDSAPDRELQFHWQDRVFRLRASHAVLQQKWVKVLRDGLRTIPSSELMHQGRLQLVEPTGQTRDIWASVSKGAVWCSPSIASSNEGLAPQPEEPAENMWGSPVALQTRSIALDIPRPEALYKFFEIPQPEGTAEPAVPVATIEAQFELAVGKVSDLQAGFDANASAQSQNERTEFQFVHESKPYSFRTRTRQEQRDWLNVLRQEVSSAVEERDDPIHAVRPPAAAPPMLTTPCLPSPRPLILCMPGAAPGCRMTVCWHRVGAVAAGPTDGRSSAS